MTARRFVCKSKAETAALGAKLAVCLHAPAFIALNGDLGAGKTVLVRGLGRALGITGAMQSPTFTIVSEYDSKPKLLHFDAYRLSDADELYAIGFDDYLKENALLVMEWAELVPDALAAQRLEIRIHGSGEEARVLEAVAIGDRYEEALKCL